MQGARLLWTGTQFFLQNLAEGTLIKGGTFIRYGIVRTQFRLNKWIKSQVTIAPWFHLIKVTLKIDKYHTTFHDYFSKVL